MQKTSSQNSGQVPNTCYKIVVRKFPICKVKQIWLKKLKLIIQDSLKVENTPAPHRIKHNVSRATEASCQVQGQQQQTWPEKAPATMFQRHYALCDILNLKHIPLKK